MKMESSDGTEGLPWGGAAAGRVLLLVTLCVLFAAGCTASVTPTPQPTENGRTAAEQAAVLAESIEIVYGSDPQPAWYSEYIDLSVEDDWAYVRTSLTDPAVAETMCHAIAATTFDDNAEPIGVTDVLIFGSGGVDLADCDVVAR